jgi:hypothetical protein
MSGQTASKLKDYFKKALKPSESQFAEFIDSLYEKAESIIPKLNNTIDLGSELKKFKSLFITDVFANKVKTTSLEDKSVSLLFNTEFHINMEAGRIQSIILTNNAVPTFTGKSGTIKLIIKQDETGGHTIDWRAFDYIAGSIGTAPDEVSLATIIFDAENDTSLVQIEKYTNL